MTTRTTQLSLCMIVLSTVVLTLGGCRRAAISPTTPEVTPMPPQASLAPSPIATVAPTAPPAPSPVLLLGAGSDKTIIAVWPAGQIKQFVAPGSPLYGYPLSPDGRQMIIDAKRLVTTTL